MKARNIERIEMKLGKGQKHINETKTQKGKWDKWESKDAKAKKKLRMKQS